MKKDQKKKIQSANKQNKKINVDKSKDKELIKGIPMRENKSTSKKYEALFSRISRSNWIEAYKEILRLTYRIKKDTGLDKNSGSMPFKYYFDVNIILNKLGILAQAKLDSESVVLSKYLSDALIKSTSFLLDRSLNKIEKGIFESEKSKLKNKSKSFELSLSGMNKEYKESLKKSIERNAELAKRMKVKKDINILKNVEDQNLKAESEESLKKIIEDFSNRMKKAVYSSITTHQEPGTLEKELIKIFGMSERQARNAALDQTARAFAEVNRANLEEAGVEKFEWLHTAGSAQPRQLHIDLSGQIFDFDNPPIIDEDTGRRGFPGDEYNCRCILIPVIEIDKNNPVQ